MRESDSVSAPAIPGERRKRSLLKESITRLGFVSYVMEMRRMLAGCRTCLDIGCGSLSPTVYLDFDYTVGLDGHQPSLDRAKQNASHDAFVFGVAGSLRELFSSGEFDCCVALDLIEHLVKEDGNRLINDMEHVASKKILVFTPNGFLQQPGSGDDLQEHRSGWDARELRTLGFSVVGMHGPKFLRGGRHQHRLKPRALGGVVSEIGHYAYTRLHPEKAAALLAVKDLRRVSKSQ